MALKKVALGELELNEWALKNFAESSAEDNSGQRSGLLKILKMALEEELTSRQRTVFLKYYAGEQTIPKIAAELGLNKSTVARHLKAALVRLRKLLKYNFLN